MISDTEKRIDDLLSQGERRIAQVFRAAIDATKSQLDMELLEALLLRGDIAGAMQLLIDIGAQIGSASSMVFITAGQSTAQFLTNAGVGYIVFDQLNERAIRIMQASQLELIREFTDEQRRAVQTVLTDGITRGIGPREQARNFRYAIGLTERQAQAVMNYRRLLENAGDATLPKGAQGEALTRALRDKRFDRSILRAIRQGQPLDAADIDRQVTAYAERSVKNRSETIARTEALRAVHEGTNEAWDQAIDGGSVDPDKVTQKWTSARDTRVRESHRRLNGQIRPLGGTWQGDYSVLRYPGDPNGAAADVIQCRCILVRRIAP